MEGNLQIGTWLYIRRSERRGIKKIIYSWWIKIHRHKDWGKSWVSSLHELWKNEASVDCCWILKHQLINRPISQVPSGKLTRKIQLCPDSFFRDKVRCLNLINLGRNNEIVQTQATCSSNRKLLNFKSCQWDHLIQHACWVQGNSILSLQGKKQLRENFVNLKAYQAMQSIVQL